LLPFNQFFDRPIFIFSFLLYRPSSVMLIPYFFCPCVYTVYWCYTQGHRDGLYILLRDEYKHRQSAAWYTRRERETSSRVDYYG
jgi:hypothetical protein